MNTVTVSPKIQKLLNKAQRLERLSKSAVLERALDDYLVRRERWLNIRILGTRTSRKFGVKRMAQVARIVDDLRR